MSLRDFFQEHRQELLRACRQDPTGDRSVERLARELCDLLDEQVSSNDVESKTGAPRRLVGEDPAIGNARASITRLARRSRLPVLFLGEVGTGKRHCAQLLHAATYPDGEFLELNHNEPLLLLERKLATLRVPSSSAAMGGISLYIHELTDSSTTVQALVAKLLRDHTLRLRLIASSRIPLTHACREGALRSDLAFGFANVVELPALRDRLGDLPALIEHFARSGAGGRGTPLVFSDSAMEALAGHVWPGNLTELSQFIERLQNGNPGRVIQPEDLTELSQRRSGMVVKIPPNGIDLARLERDLLLQALALADNNRSRAARLLGLTRDQIRYRLSKLDLASCDEAEVSVGS